MKKTTRLLAVGISAVSLLLLNTPRAGAQSTDVLKEMGDLLQKQGQQIQELLIGRAEDQKKIQHLEQLVGETGQKAEQSQRAATNAQQKAEEIAADVAARVQTLQSGPSEEASATRNFLLTGMADMTYQKSDGQNGSFAQAHVAPILLFRAGDKILFETELEMKVASDGSTELGLEYAQLDYLVNDSLTLIAGRFVLPLGVVREKHDAVWINKLPIMPLPESDVTALIPENDIGVQARGGFHLNDRALMTYALYVANGPGSGGDGPGHLDSTGTWTTSNPFNGGSSMSGTPNGGGRLAVFYPWKPNHDVEIGVSGQTGRGMDNLMWSAFALDASLHLGPNLELRGEFINTWEDTTDVGALRRKGWWAQAAYKLAGLNLEWPLINNFEAVFRYGGEQLPDGHINEYDLGLIYHVSNTLLLKGAYSFMDGNAFNQDTGNNRWPNMFTFQVAYGF